MNDNHDPALSAHLSELIGIAKEVGAVRAWLVRGSQSIQVLPRFEPDARPVFVAPGVTVPIQSVYDLTIQRDRGGVMLLLYFPANDGGPAGVEVRE